MPLNPYRLDLRQSDEKILAMSKTEPFRSTLADLENRMDALAKEAEPLRKLRSAALDIMLHGKTRRCLNCNSALGNTSEFCDDTCRDEAKASLDLRKVDFGAVTP